MNLPPDAQPDFVRLFEEQRENVRAQLARLVPHIAQHPAVHECAVFGIPDDKWGESVQAAVQLRPHQQATEADLAAFLRERLGPVQTPKRIHFMSELPRSPVGKVLKNAVRDLAIASGSNT